MVVAHFRPRVNSALVWVGPEAGPQQEAESFCSWRRSDCRCRLLQASQGVLITDGFTCSHLSAPLQRSETSLRGLSYCSHGDNSRPARRAGWWTFAQLADVETFCPDGHRCVHKLRHRQNTTSGYKSPRCRDIYLSAADQGPTAGGLPAPFSSTIPCQFAY